MYHEDMHHQMLPSQKTSAGSTRHFWPSACIFVIGFFAPLHGIIM
jgi:hypothetical protein